MSSFKEKIIQDHAFVVRIYLFLRHLAIKPILYYKFVRDYLKFKKLAKNQSRFKLEWRHRYPCLYDNTEYTAFDRHYVYHVAWAERVLVKTKPQEHLDVSSSIFFPATLSAFMPVKFYDYRPAGIVLDNLYSGRADLLNLPFADNSVASLSTLHTVEHIGLGRYGDKIGPDDDLKAMNELKRVLKPGGDLLFVVPIGKPRISFNGHRIYSYDQLISYFKELTLKEFALITNDPRDGGLIYNAPKEMVDKQDYGCGCFWFTK